MKAKLLLSLKRSLWIGTMLTIITPFLSSYKVTDLKQFSELRFGFPFRFISQKSELTPFEENLPLRLHFLSPWENSTEIIIENFIFSLIIIVTFIFLINIIWTFLRNNIQN